jgi:hypothetical protein
MITTSVVLDGTVTVGVLAYLLVYWLAYLLAYLLVAWTWIALKSFLSSECGSVF